MLTCLTTFRFDARKSLDNATISVCECFIHDNFLSAFQCALSNGQGLDGRGVPHVTVGIEVPLNHGLPTLSSTQQSLPTLSSVNSSLPTSSSTNNASFHAVPPSPTKQLSSSNPFYPTFRPQLPSGISHKQLVSPSRTSHLASSPAALSFSPTISRTTTSSGYGISVSSTANIPVFGTFLLIYYLPLLNNI